MFSKVLRPHYGPSTEPILFRMHSYRQSTSVMTRIRRAPSAVSAGAFYGKGAIPDDWLNIVAERNLIESLASELYKASEELELN